MFRIEGDGSKNTKIWKDDELIDWDECLIDISDDGCVADVDRVIGKIDRVVLLGVYSVIGDGRFDNTKLFIFDEMLRGVQSVVINIKKESNPMINIRAVFLPNLLEGE